MQFEKVINDEFLEGGETAKQKPQVVEAANCDEEDKCCKCFPLKMGVKLLCVFVLFNAYLMVITAYHHKNKSMTLFVLCMIMLVGPIYSFIIFAIWYKD